MSLPFLPKIAGPAYLTQCACFTCRKSFKKNLADPRYAPGCPECGRPLVPMGRYFRAPRKADSTQWKKVEMLSRAGVYFGGSQSWELGAFPDTPREARAFLAKNRHLLEHRAAARERGKAAATAEIERTEAKRHAARRQAPKKNEPKSSAPASGLAPSRGSAQALRQA